ncbi:MAG: DUF58 domain-containing protein [Anaerolineae bacterium]|nr:DUF58 domain-containing protein [Anaerolineae bacterium]
MHITNRGILMLLLAAPIIAAGTWAPLLQWVGLAYIIVLLLLLALDWRLAQPLAQRFEVRRDHDDKLSLGADNPITLTVRNRSPRPIAIAARDEPPDEFGVDVRVVYGRVPPRQQWQTIYHVHPLRRGDYTFGKLNLRWSGPLDLIMRQGRADLDEAVKVYPNLLDVRRYDLLLQRNRLQELGLRSTRQFGEGTEFERLREYLPDDEYRRIDWKATARRHRPVTVEYQTERSQNVVALLDVGRMMQSPVANMAKLDYVINAVLLLGYVASGKGDKVGMMSFAQDVRQYLAPRQGRGQFYRMLELLYAVEAEPVESDYRRALSYLATKQRKRALIVIFTDLSGGVSMDALVSHVSVLARRSLPLVVTISDPDVVQAARQRPVDSQTVYQRAAAAQLLDERKVALDTLRNRGVLTLDVPANQLSIAVINRYLELKAKTML